MLRSAGCIHRGGIAGSHGSCQTVFQRGCAREKVCKAEGTAVAKACLQHRRQATVAGMEQASQRWGKRNNTGELEYTGLFKTL